jgi:hypothetical protein
MTTHALIVRSATYHLPGQRQRLEALAVIKRRAVRP